MPRNGQTTVTFNPRFFDTILKSAGVDALTTSIGEDVLETAKRTAPVDTGDYRDGLHLEKRESRYRRVVRVVGADPKTLLVESKTGNLARSLKTAGR